MRIVIDVYIEIIRNTSFLVQLFFFFFALPSLGIQMSATTAASVSQCVTHEMGFARSVADRVIFMAEGEILEQAPPDQFFGSPRHPKAQGFLGQILNH